MGCGASSGDGDRSFTHVRTLGEGASCSVDEVIDNATNYHCARKRMKKNALNKDLWKKEVEILKILATKGPHPNVLEFISADQDKKNFYITTKMCAGGELFDRVTQGKFTEKIAAYYSRMMLEGLYHLHKFKIFHRDLKPENFVFESSSEDSSMRLIDFGCAVVMEPNDTTDILCGSSYYMAPEILKKTKYTGNDIAKSDAWSIGVIIFMFITGYPPFYGDTDKEIYKAIVRKDPLSGNQAIKQAEDPNSVWNLLKALLIKDPDKRMSVKEALAHPWIQGAALDVEIDPAIVKSLENFHKSNRLKKAVARVLGNRMTEKDKEQVMSVFKRFDKDGNGRLDKAEVAELMKYINKADVHNNLAAKLMVNALDADGDGEVDAEEFVAMHAAQMLESEKTAADLFKEFDKSGDGYLTKEELREVLSEATSPDMIEKMIKEADGNGDGKIDFEEWCKAVRRTSTVMQGRSESPS